MATMNTFGPTGSGLHPGQATLVRVHDPEQHGMVSRRRGPYLVATLMLAATVYITGGGGAFYDAAYGLVTRTEARWIRAPAAPLSFLNSQKPPRDRFELQGIVYSSNRPIAVINQRPCAPGEKVTVKVGNQTEVIECLSIDPHLVQIRTLEGETASLELSAALVPECPDSVSADTP